MQTIHFRATISGTYIDCISLISFRTLGSFSSWHAHPKIFWNLISNPDLLTHDVISCLCTIYRSCQSTNIIFFYYCTEHWLDFHRKIDYNCIVLFLRSNSGLEFQLTICLFPFFLPTIITVRLTSNILFRISLNYFQPFNKSPPFSFKMFQYQITPASKGISCFWLLLFPNVVFSSEMERDLLRSQHNGKITFFVFPQREPTE